MYNGYLPLNKYVFEHTYQLMTKNKYKRMAKNKKPKANLIS